MKNPSPKISVIMPAYNGARFIKKSIDSVLAQTRKDFELIIINDGSTDTTAETVRRYRDGRIKYIENRKNLGTSKARNRGLRRARGEYIAYCDHDDIFYPNHLERLAGALEAQPEIGLSYGSYRILRCGLPPEVFPKANFDRDKLEALDNIIGAPFNVMHRRRCVEKVGVFDESSVIAKHAYEDLDLWLRISDHFEFRHVSEILGDYIHHGMNRCVGINTGISCEYIIRKRWRKQDTNAKRLEYIRRHGVDVIHNLVKRANIGYAARLSEEFGRISGGYQPLLCRGLCGLAKGDLRGALDLFKRSLRLLRRQKDIPDTILRKDLLTIKLHTGKAYLRLGKANHALKNLLDSMSLGSPGPEATHMLAHCYLEMGKRDKAQGLLRGMAYAHSHMLRGACYFSKKRFIMAAREFEAASRKDPRTAMYRYNLGMTYVKLGNHKRSVAQFRKVLSLDPRHSRAEKMLLRLSRGIKDPPNSPEASVLLCTYNRARILPKAVESVLAQTFKNFELVIVNDGSTDKTKEVLSRYTDKRMIYLEKPHGGIASARNLGLRIAMGEYVAYLDDDCEYSPNHLAALIGFLKCHPSVGMAYSDWLSCQPIGKPAVRRFDFDRSRLESMVLPITPFHVMHRRGCIDRAGPFDERFISMDDADMWLRISDTSSIAHLPMTTVRHTAYPDMPMLTNSPYKGEEVEVLVKKRILKAKSAGRIKEYINDHSIPVIRKIITYRNIRYARRLSREFYHRIKNYQTFACIGLCDFGAGKFHTALAAFRKSMREAPRRWQTLDPEKRDQVVTIKVCMALSYLNLRDFRLAEKTCEEIRAVYPKNAEAKIVLARCAIHRQACHRALDLMTDIECSPEVYNLRGCCYFMMKRHGRASREFGKAVAMRPDIALYRHNLALAYRAKKRSAEAAAEMSAIPPHPCLPAGMLPSPLRGEEKGEGTLAIKSQRTLSFGIRGRIGTNDDR